jgi:hypothetical protein
MHEVPMRPLLRLLTALATFSAVLGSACGTPSSDAGDAGTPPQDTCDAGAPDASAPDAESKAAHCAAQFGSELTNAFGRLDGTVLAVVRPVDTQCPMPNSDHIVVQILMHGAAYRIVVNVVSDGRNGTDTRLRYAEVEHALVDEAWSEGWHPGSTLDYPTSLGVHNDRFTPTLPDDLIARVTDRITVGARISAFATSSGGSRADSAHLVHRNDSNGAHDVDGALVLAPSSSAPLFLLFHFDGQVL